ncbi:sce7726 family protein [Bacillus cereus]|uniref:sce7726 family protein n=1 Tax=Bacillus cereus TaxID=1396 RepID=UPI002ABF74F2|nr:sce7726 family protein [Bacillus cereus]MDZ4633208.1 sce7726 family protein [Bacillus cereus]
MEKLKDYHVREELFKYLEEQYINCSDTIIINELGICQGQSRVDVAVVNGIMHGYEIKSESDTLERLPRQIEYYNKVFDRVTIVVAVDYLEHVKEMVPKWWGIISVRNRHGEIKLKKLRQGRANKKIDPFAVSQFLWKDEALEILKEKGLQRGYLSKPKRVILEHLAETIEINELKDLVNLQLKQREGWRDHVLLM